MRVRASLALAGLAGIAVVATFLSGGAAQAPASASLNLQNVALFDRGEYYLGTATHFALANSLGYEPAPAAKAIGDLGLNSFRDEVYWDPDHPGQDSEPRLKLKSFMDATPAKPMLVLNGRATGSASAPLSDRARASFSNFAVRAVGAASPRSPLFEIWNEWNRTADLKAKPMTTQGQTSDPRYSGNYASLTKAAVSGIRAKYPDAKVLVGAAAFDPHWVWLADFVRQGGLAGATGLSVHLYNQCAGKQRGSDELIARLRESQKVLGPLMQNQPVDIYVTEWGWSTGSACRVDSDFVAANSAEFLLGAAALPWVKGTWQYELKDESATSGEFEANFGILTSNYRPKASTCAVRDAAKLLRSVRSIGMVPLANGVTVVVARTDKENLAIIWDGQNRSGLNARIRTQSVVSADICGSPHPTSAGQPIAIHAMPTVIHLGGKLPTISVSAAQ